jgi:hypothetical protein
MDRDEFIIAVYCAGCERYHALEALHSIRRGGFAPALRTKK